MQVENAKPSDRFATMGKADLAAEYVNLIGYDPFKDDPEITEDEVRETLAEYVAEISEEE